MIIAKMLILFALFSPIDRHKPIKPVYPPHYMEFIKIAKCEQPSRNGKGWHGIAWHQNYNYSFSGGMGMTTQNWSDFKRKGQPTQMSRATPVEQLWSAYRLYMWAEKTYPGNGESAWVCSKMVGFTGLPKH
jgi:hypothetical protein